MNYFYRNKTISTEDSVNIPNRESCCMAAH